MMEGDSLESPDLNQEIERLTYEIKQKEKIIKDQEEIIKSLRLVNGDIKEEYEELDKEHQLMRQSYDRLKRDAASKDGDLDSISHALSEAQASCEGFRKKYEERTEQLRQSKEAAATFRRDLDASKALNEELSLKVMKLEAASQLSESGKRKRDCERDEAIAQELHDLKAQIITLTRTVKTCLMPPPPPLPPKTHSALARSSQPKHDENRADSHTSGIHFSMADEIGEIMDSSSVKSVSPSLARLERANELARRNKQMKPLHQTSYPLELDTFDTTNSEFDIQRGKVSRTALADSSNQRKPVKKAEAFIV